MRAMCGVEHKDRKLANDSLWMLDFNEAIDKKLCV